MSVTFSRLKKPLYRFHWNPAWRYLDSQGYSLPDTVNTVKSSYLQAIRTTLSERKLVYYKNNSFPLTRKYQRRRKSNNENFTSSDPNGRSTITVTLQTKMRAWTWRLIIKGVSVENILYRQVSVLVARWNTVLVIFTISSHV